MTGKQKRAGKKTGKDERDKSVEQLTDEKLTGVAGGIVRRQDPCSPEQCAPPPPPTREKCRPGPECAVVRAR
jgi:hypothetical protein